MVRLSRHRGVAQPGRAPDLGSGGFAGSNPAAPITVHRLRQTHRWPSLIGLGRRRRSRLLRREANRLAADAADRETMRIVREQMAELAP